MQLNERQRTIVRLIDDDVFSVETCEKYWNENAGRLSEGTGLYTFYLDQVKKVNAFMAAVNGILRVLDDRADAKGRGENTS